MKARLYRLEASDVPRMVPLGIEFYEEGHLLGRFVPEVFEDNWRGFIDRGIGVVIGADAGGELAGVIGGILAPDLNDGVLVANETFWFMAKGFRKGFLAMKLQYAFERAAADSGAERVSMAHLANETGLRLGRLFARKGYKQMETHYMREV